MKCKEKLELMQEKIDDLEFELRYMKDVLNDIQSLDNEVTDEIMYMINCRKFNKEQELSVKRLLRYVYGLEVDVAMKDYELSDYELRTNSYRLAKEGV